MTSRKKRKHKEYILDLMAHWSHCDLGEGSCKYGENVYDCPVMASALFRLTQK
jgi:hypothetical protein